MTCCIVANDVQGFIREKEAQTCMNLVQTCDVSIDRKMRHILLSMEHRVNGSQLQRKSGGRNE